MIFLLKWTRLNLKILHHPVSENTETNAGERVQEQVDQSLGEDNKAIAQNLLMQAFYLKRKQKRNVKRL